MKARSKKLKFASRDGLKLHGTLTAPAKDVTGAMLCVHGITSDRSEWGIFDEVASKLAEEGIASLRFDFRGHGDSTLNEDKITLAGVLSDIVSAWGELEGRLDADGKDLKRYIMGSSFGGGLSYAAAGIIGRIDRAFLLAPVFDYFVDIENCAPHWHADLKKKDHFRYNDLRLGRALLNEALYFDPFAHSSVSTTIFHGTADSDVVIDLSRAVAAKHANVELVPVDGAGHVLAVPEDFDMKEEASWGYVRFMLEQVRRRIR